MKKISIRPIRALKIRITILAPYTTKKNIRLQYKKKMLELFEQKKKKHEFDHIQKKKNFH